MADNSTIVDRMKTEKVETTIPNTNYNTNEATVDENKISTGKVRRRTGRPQLNAADFSRGLG